MIMGENMAISTRVRHGNGVDVHENWKKSELMHMYRSFNSGKTTFSALSLFVLNSKQPEYGVLASREPEVLRACQMPDHQRIVDLLIVYRSDSASGNEINTNILNTPGILSERGPSGNTTAHLLATYGSEAVRERMRSMHELHVLINNHGTSVGRLLAETDRNYREMVLGLKAF